MVSGTSGQRRCCDAGVGIILPINHMKLLKIADPLQVSKAFSIKRFFNEE